MASWTCLVFYVISLGPRPVGEERSPRLSLYYRMPLLLLRMGQVVREPEGAQEHLERMVATAAEKLGEMF